MMMDFMDQRAQRMIKLAAASTEQCIWWNLAQNDQTT